MERARATGRSAATNGSSDCGLLLQWSRSSGKKSSVISLFTLLGHMVVFTLKQTVERDGREIGSHYLPNRAVKHLFLPLISA